MTLGLASRFVPDADCRGWLHSCDQLRFCALLGLTKSSDVCFGRARGRQTCPVGRGLASQRPRAERPSFQARDVDIYSNHTYLPSEEFFLQTIHDSRRFCISLLGVENAVVVFFFVRPLSRRRHSLRPAPFAKSVTVNDHVSHPGWSSLWTLGMSFHSTQPGVSKIRQYPTKPFFRLPCPRAAHRSLHRPFPATSVLSVARASILPSCSS